MDPAQLSQLLTVMQDNQAAQQKQFVEAVRHLQSQQAAAAAAPVAPSAPAALRTQRAKIPAASHFQGSARHLDDWLREIKQQFEWYEYTADTVQVAMAAVHLKGVALDWWAALPASTLTTLRASFPAFEAALRSRFQPVNSAQTARLALDALRQGARQSVADYISSFRRLLVSVPTMSEEDRVHRFVQGLRGSVQQHLIVQGVSTLDAAISMAARVGSLGQFAAASGAAAAANGDAMDLAALGFDGIEGLEQDTDSAGDTPVTRAELQKMQQQLLAAVQHRGSNNTAKRAPSGRGGRGPLRVPGLSAQQVREHMDNGLCFVCGQSGHRKFDCPQNKNKHQSGN